MGFVIRYSPMNIAYIVYRFPCISEPFIMDQITGMLDHKQNVAIYADVGRTADPIHPQVEAYGLMEKTRFLPRVAKSRQRLLRQAGKAALAKAGFANRIWRSDLSLTEKIHSLAKFHGFVWPKAPKFDIVHCQFGCVAKTYWTSKTLWNAKLVVSFRGHDFSSLPRRFGPGMYKELFQ